MITFRDDLHGIDWDALKQDLIDDDFHNGRTTKQLQLSFENSACVAMAFSGSQCIGNARLLSDGVGNAFAIDVWTHSRHRNQGVARKMMTMLMKAVPGQHIYLQTDTAVGFYEKLGYAKQPEGMSIVVGDYLVNETR
jgi:ribosomal protein S18 acetylase RimI-like enzyme